MDELGLHMLSNAITFRKDVRINVNATDSDEEPPEQNIGKIGLDSTYGYLRTKIDTNPKYILLNTLWLLSAL